MSTKADLKVVKHRVRCLVELTHEWRKADKTALDLQALIYDERIKTLNAGVSELRRLVYIGVGIALVLNVAVLVLRK